MPDERNVEELFDLVASDGSPLGKSKPRSAVHMDGDWHRAIHVWVYGIRNGSAFLLFQQRAFDKDSMPGKLCATVGGHLSAGETVEDAVREVEEEIGIVGDLDSMNYCGVRVCANDVKLGILDRELQDVYLLRDERPLERYQPDKREVCRLSEARLRDVLALWSNEVDQILCRSLDVRTGTIEQTSIVRQDFAGQIDRYPYRVAIAVERVLSGATHFAV